MERCADGVALTAGMRAGMSTSEVSVALGRPWWDAWLALGYRTIAAANDASTDFATIARALRQARAQAPERYGYETRAGLGDTARATQRTEQDKR
jgi:hypothetical protein